MLDLSFSARQEFLERHPYPQCVPTLCVATCDRRPSSLLKPTIDYVAVRYGEYSDGCVCQADAILPHCPRILLDDMDHFGVVQRGFELTTRVPPTRAPPLPGTCARPRASVCLMSGAWAEKVLSRRAHLFAAGPAWPSFPATDQYDPARLWLTCVSLALRNPTTRNLADEGSSQAHA